MPAKDSIWTEYKVEQLRALWGSGLTAREIAEALGDAISRAAVIGKANRLGLAAQKPGFTPTGNGRKHNGRKPRVPPPPKPVPWVPKPPPPPPPPQQGPPRMRRLQLLQLEDHHCKWPIGDPHRLGFHFCAADTAGGAVYCKTHMRMAFARTHQKG